MMNVSVPILHCLTRRFLLLYQSIESKKHQKKLSIGSSSQQDLLARRRQMSNVMFVVGQQKANTQQETKTTSSIFTHPASTKKLVLFTFSKEFISKSSITSSTAKMLRKMLPDMQQCRHC